MKFCVHHHLKVLLACIVLAASTASARVQGITKLVPCASGNDIRFGNSVAKDRNVIAVGAPNGDPLDGLPGFVCVYESTKVACCTFSEGPARPRFGRTLALQDDVLAIGDGHAVYIYERRAPHVWNKLEVFRYGVIAGFAMSEGRIAVSVVPGNRVVILDVNEDGDWSESDSIDLPASTGTYNVELGGNTVLAGDLDPPQVFVYEEGEQGWQQTGVISSPEVDADGGFGSGLALLRGEAYITNPLLKKQDVGVVYVFERGHSSSWSLIQRLTPRKGQALQRFGEAIDVGPDGLFIGSPSYDARFGGEDQGAVYQYERDGSGKWEFVQRHVNPAKSEEFSYFGTSVAADGGLFVVGAPAPHGGSIGQPPRVYLLPTGR